MHDENTYLREGEKCPDCGSTERGGECPRAATIREIKDWARKYMEATTKHYGTDKHGIDPEDLRTALENLLAENKETT